MSRKARIEFHGSFNIEIGSGIDDSELPTVLAQTADGITEAISELVFGEDIKVSVELPAQNVG